jgi:hypothetical protein
MKKQQVSKIRYGQFHLYLDEDILAQVKELAQKEGRTTAELVREAMADLLKKRKGYRGKGPFLSERKANKRTT